MRKEDELILACACFTIPGEQQKRIDQLLSSQLDWKYITKFAVRHSVTNLVYRNIKNASVSLDPDIPQLLRNVVLQNNARSLFQTGFLLKLLALFEEESIIVVPFKGPALSQILYNDPAVRSYGDLDILVKVTDVASASRLLVQQGFIPEIELTETAFSTYVRTEDDIIFHNPKSNLLVELHWELSGQYLRHPLGFDCFQKNLQVIEIAGRAMYSLSTEDLLLYLCIHGNKHMWSRLEWLCCVAELIKSHDDLDWEEFFNRADEFQCVRMVSLALALVAELLDTKLPDHVMERLHDDINITPLYYTVVNILFPEDLTQPGGENRFSRFHLQNRDSWQDRLRYCCRLLFQPTFQEWHTWPLPGHLSFLYYAFRPLRLGWEFLKKH
jgi:Uncharacterised nucleotidyltransferase